MRLSPALVVLAACGGSRATPDASIDSQVYRDIYAAVSDDNLTAQLATLGHERYDDAGKEAFRAAWTADMQGFGMTVTPLDYAGGEDLQAVLPGESPDSVVIIVHYDSMGPPGVETSNPAVDDDMTGMSTMIETARILSSYQGRLQHTVRFVATDQEELGMLAGAYAYAHWIQADSAANGYKVIAAIDDEQSGWNCHTSTGGCGTDTPVWPLIDIFSCDGTTMYDSQALGDQLQMVVRDLAPALSVNRGCLANASDHYAMWTIGVPAVVYTEHDALLNPHFDTEGGDALDQIDTAYFTSLARPAVAFAATVVGIDP